MELEVLREVQVHRIESNIENSRKLRLMLLTISKISAPNYSKSQASIKQRSWKHKNLKLRGQ